MNFRTGRTALFAGLLTTILMVATVAPGNSYAQEPQLQPLVDSWSHMLAAGDYLRIQFFDGRNTEDLYVQVDEEGRITLPLVGGINVLGLTPGKAADEIEFFYTEYYHQPKASCQVLSYGQLDVFVFGTDHPGQIYSLDNGSSLLDILTEIEFPISGQYRRLHVIRGISSLTSLTSLQVLATRPVVDGGNALAMSAPSAMTRTGNTLPARQNWRTWLYDLQDDPDTTIWVIDPLRLTNEGELSAYNVELKQNDLLFIPTAERLVTIEGVFKSGRYELLADENLGDILRLTGTVNYRADLTNAVIQRYDSDGTLSRIIVNLRPGLDDFSFMESIQLENRDVIRILPREQRIFVLGSVNEAGAFDFFEDSTVLDYLSLAKGETVDANLAWIAIIRQPRDRRDSGEASTVIQANFKDIHKGLPMCTDVSLLPGDVIYVPPKGQEFKIGDIMQAASTFVTGLAIVDRSGSSSN